MSQELHVERDSGGWKKAGLVPLAETVGKNFIREGAELILKVQLFRILTVNSLRAVDSVISSGS